MPSVMSSELEPKASKPTTCRMFETPLIEYFSRIHPLSPAAFWVPALLGLVGWQQSAKEGAGDAGGDDYSDMYGG